MTLGQIRSSPAQASHIELIKRYQVRNFARQRAKLVVEEVECLDVLHAEQLGRQLRQTHVNQLKTDVPCACERAERRASASTHIDHSRVVLESFLDDASRRLAAKNDLSH